MFDSVRVTGPGLVCTFPGADCEDGVHVVVRGLNRKVNRRFRTFQCAVEKSMESILSVSRRQKNWHAFTCTTIALKNKCRVLTLSAVSLSVSHWQDREKMFISTVRNAEKWKKIPTTLEGNLQCSPSPKDVPRKTTYTSLPVTFRTSAQNNKILGNNAIGGERSLPASPCYVSFTST